MSKQCGESLYENKPILLFAVTSHITMAFFKGQIDFMRKAGFEIAVVCSPGWENEEGVSYYPIAMEREIAIAKDLKSLYLLVKLFCKIKPVIVNAGTPKAGLLAGLAAFLTRVPIRIYTCHGLRLETMTGWKRQLLMLTERITAFCAKQVVCVSSSLRQRVLELGLAAPRKVTVIGAGSCNGINMERFTKSGRYSLPSDIKARASNPKAVFIGFVGRFTRDKGIAELIEAFEVLKKKSPDLYLLLLGGFEEGDPVAEDIRQKIMQDERIINVGFIADTVPYYQVMEMVVLPTYREGLPTVLLEAGAMGLPVVAARVTGCVDVVMHGHTGLLVPIGDSTALAEAVWHLLTDKKSAFEMGQKARCRVEELYGQTKVWQNAVEFYKKLITLEEIREKGGGGMLKRSVDLFLAVALLVLLAPVFLLVAVLIRIKLGTPVIFTQERPGLYGKKFNIFKFRTMTNEKNAQGDLLPDEERITKFGKVLRQLSLDELPQMFNVLRGELSLVGPRPLLTEYLPLYTPEQNRRHNVKPGITGWAQVHGRNAVDWEKKFELDVWYVDHQSFWLDIKILCMTVIKVVARDGIKYRGHSINMPKFRGAAK